MEPSPGSRWQSAVCRTQVIVVRPPAGPAAHGVELECGGHPMVPLDATSGDGLSLVATHAGGTLTGKRYVHEPTELEVLCTRPGEGSLAVDGEPLAMKDPKPLPSSD